MSGRKTNRDQYSGIPWVDVTPQQARAHPKGHLGSLLWVIALYFIGTSIAKFYFAMAAGAGVGIAVLNGIWPFLAGIGLALRVPWSVFMVIVSVAITAYSLFAGLRPHFSLPENAAPPALGETLPYLLDMIVNVAILFYLIDGDRPNLIYRHRYRQYSAVEPDDV